MEIRICFRFIYDITNINFYNLLLGYKGVIVMNKRTLDKLEEILKGKD